MLINGLLYLFTLFFLPTIHVALAQSSEIPDDVLKGTPDCAIACFDKTANNTMDFREDNSSQLCHNKTLYHHVYTCVKDDCTLLERLDFLNITQTRCGMPKTDLREQVRIPTLTVGTLAAIFFILRVISKVIGYVPYGHDDTLILISFPLVMSFDVLSQIMLTKGLGRDIWFVDREDIPSLLLIILIAEFHYILSLGIIKLSILAFFLRTFPDNQFHIKVRWTMGFVLVLTVGTLVFAIIQRHPISLVWTGWAEKVPRGVLVPINPLTIAHGSTNVALDLWMIYLPMTQLWKLGIKPKKKLGIMAMFGVGAFLTVASSVRIPSAAKFAASWNVTADCTGTVLWSNVEICVGIMVACMPGARQFVRDVMPRIRRVEPSDDSGTGIWIIRSLRTIKLTTRMTEARTLPTMKKSEATTHTTRMTDDETVVGSLARADTYLEEK